MSARSTPPGSILAIAHATCDFSPCRKARRMQSFTSCNTVFPISRHNSSCRARYRICSGWGIPPISRGYAASADDAFETTLTTSPRSRHTKKEHAARFTRIEMFISSASYYSKAQTVVSRDACEQSEKTVKSKYRNRIRWRKTGSVTVPEHFNCLYETRNILAVDRDLPPCIADSPNNYRSTPTAQL